QPERDLRFERREVVVDVARPGRRSEALHPGRAGSAEQEDPLIGPVGGFALREGLLAEAIVDVVQQRAVPRVEPRARRRTLAAVQPPAGHSELPELAMDRPPPGPGGRIGEVDVALPVTIGRGRAAGHRGALVTL